MSGKIYAFHPQNFLECLCCALFSGLLLYLVRSGRYLSYVTPRMKPYFYFSALVMAVWAVQKASGIFWLQYRMRSGHCLVLAVPMVLLFFPYTPLAVSDVVENHVKEESTLPAPELPVKEAPVITDEPLETDTEEKKDLTDAQKAPEAEAQTVDTGENGLPGLDAKNRQITVADEDFALWLAELNENSRKYDGYRICITGFVFNEYFVPREGEFTISRLAMTCCIADLSPAGVDCIYGEAEKLESEEWITVQGVLSVGQFEMNGIVHDKPVIQVLDTASAEPVEDYIYPMV